MSKRVEASVETARAEAAAAAETAQPQPTAPAHPRGRFASAPAKGTLVVAIVAAIILLTILLPTTAPGPKYTDVREITAAPAAYDGKTVAVVGGVQQGSVSVGAALAFNLTDYTDANVSIRVVYHGGWDANFGEDKKVLVEGPIQMDGGVPKLLATKLSIGCPTDYRGSSTPQ